MSRRRRPRLGLRGITLPRSARGRILAGIVAFVALFAVWTAWDLRAARNDLLDARDELSAATTDIANATDASAAATLRRATQHALARTNSAASRVRQSPVLRVAAVVPGVSTQRMGALRAVDTARDAALIGDRLAAVAQQHSGDLTVRQGAIDIDGLRALAQAVSDAGRQLDALERTHRGAQWGPLGRATADLDDLIAETAARLTNSGGVMRVAADLFGAQGPQQIFIALMNNAEMRDQGMVLSYAVAETNDGSFRITRSGSVLDLPVNKPVTTPALPEGTRKVFGSLAPDRIWQSVNATADTALSGALVRSLYEAATGTKADGVVALDVLALSRLLAVTGPIAVEGIAEPIGEQNVARVLLDDLYRAGAGRSFVEARDDRLEQLGATTAALLEHIRTSSLNGTALVRALGDAARGGHAWVSTADPDGQRDLERAGLSGGPGRVNPERTFHLSVQNGTATKLDYFVDPEVDVDVDVSEDGTAIVTTKVTLTNGAPVPAPVGEQFGPDGFVTKTAGFYRGRVYLWSPAGSDQLDSVSESGLRLSFKVVDIPAGGRASVSFTTVLPRAVRDDELRLRFVPQPRVRPATLRVAVNGVGWDVRDANRSLEWGRTVDLAWRLTRA